MNTPHQYVRRRAGPGRTKIIVFASVVLGLVVVNIVTALAFHGRTYPGTDAGGKQVGSITYASLAAKVTNNEFLPANVTLTYKKESTKLATTELGISVDMTHLKQSVYGARAWPPVINFVTGQSVALPMTINEAAFTRGYATIRQKYEKQAAPPKLVMVDYIFKVQPAVKAVTLDRTAFREQLVAALQAGRTTVPLPTVPTTPQQLQMADKQYGWDELIKQQNTALTYYYSGKSKQLTARDVGMWYVPKADTYVLSDDKIRASIAQLGVESGTAIRNMPEALAATKQALQSHQSLAFSLLAAPPSP
jgi:vancomycin resistance protein YoaR